MSESDKQEPGQQQEKEGQFSIQRIYVKDFSFESPNAPAIFQNEWQPELNLDINTNAKKVADNIHEVVLSLTVTVKSDNQVAFLAEVKQAGLFEIVGFPTEQLHHALGSFCPNILYPYARAVLTDMVGQGSFPQLVLAPINFDALYVEHMKKQEAETGEGTASAAH